MLMHNPMQPVFSHYSTTHHHPVRFPSDCYPNTGQNGLPPNASFATYSHPDPLRNNDPYPAPNFPSHSTLPSATLTAATPTPHATSSSTSVSTHLPAFTPLESPAVGSIHLIPALAHIPAAPRDHLIYHQLFSRWIQDPVAARQLDNWNKNQIMVNVDAVSVVCIAASNWRASVRIGMNGWVVEEEVPTNESDVRRVTARLLVSGG
ncbi:hypothetical protein BCR44DRAFT_1287102 [Catenaria anguillulae PL171]|uniref:Uncharacterized protein n=1 Tax=Catenaria anguillulae PL171 TaxID=765915 RepID=A0A1Y2H8R6_9FUNG|nr:hypothetical protein BCR44DRAFT_1287102 [Catenaria anguillulae PL171]